MSATERPLSRKTIATYAIGSLGTGGFATLPGLVLVYYLTDNLGLAAILSGAVVTVAKVWDVFIDPLIGARSDRSLQRHGTRRRFMMLGGLLLPVFFIVTFAVPLGLPAWLSATWVFIAFVLTATAFSLFQVPYIALPAELTDGYDQRTRLLAMRVVVLTVAILLFGAGGPALRSLGGSNHYLGYLLMAIVAGVVIGVGMLISSRVAPTRVVSNQEAAVSRVELVETAAGYRAGFATLRRSQPFRALVFTFLLQALATGLMLAGAQYVATYVLQSEDAVTYLFIALIAPAILFAPIWAGIARRIGKERGFLIASILFGVAALAMVGLLWAPGAWVYAPVALAGAGYAGMQSLPMSMLPDVISHHARAHGPGAAGAFGGIWTAGETTGMALGATALTVILAITGYVSSVADEHAVQSASALAGIVLSFSIVPAALIGVSLISLARYKLRKTDIDEQATAKVAV
ncbi:MAG TPA: MFS transporter [Galbitalea sp.]|nr:MFS transporter [Galbitalea sp.]